MKGSKLAVEQISTDEIIELGEIINKSEESTIFHTSEWNNILSEVFGIRMVALIAKRNGEPVGSLLLNQNGKFGPRTVYRSPDRKFETVYGGPLAISGFADQDLIKKELIKYLHSRSKASFIELWVPPDVRTDALREIGYEVTPFYTSILNLEKSEEDLWSNIHQKTRNQIRKAQKSGVQIIKDGSVYLAEYYEMVKETLGSEGVSVLPLRFYEEVLNVLEPKKMAKLFIATHKGKAISGAIFLFYKDTVYYWHGASFREYLSVSPNNLIQWELIKHSQQEGYKKYDLLSIEPDRLPGIANFKMRFGGETKPYHRCLWKTPFYRLPLIRYYVTHPSYLYERISARLREGRVS
jgi:hypothetical protein